MVNCLESSTERLSSIFINDYCYQNQSDETCARIERNIDATPDLLYWLFGIYPLIVCIPALILNMTFVCVATHGAIERKLSRKLYIFLVNRSLGDILYLLLTIFLALSCIVLEGHFPLDILAVIMVVNYVSFWGSMVGFISLCLLKLCALVKPLHARKLVTTKRCLLVVYVSWLAALLYTMFLLFLLSLTMIEPLAKWSKCTAASCIRAAFSINATLDICCYFLTLTIFIFTLVASHRIQLNRKLSTRSRSITENSLVCGVEVAVRRSSNPLVQQVRLRKLTLSIAIFALLYSLPTFGAMRFLLKYNECYYSLGWYRALTIVGSARIFFIVRTFIDPVINFCTHRRLREALTEKFTSYSSLRRHCSDALN
uniref:G-protein coupled receptors family 1 profile domain-containing protein n=1 Tax=Plectus sambesii TaxID=2011161 RepID=A0A914X970_9BILA